MPWGSSDTWKDKTRHLASRFKSVVTSSRLPSRPPQTRFSTFLFSPPHLALSAVILGLCS